MNTKDELKIYYVSLKTKDWDDESKERYRSFIYEDFETWYEGYLFGMNKKKNNENSNNN